MKQKKESDRWLGKNVFFITKNKLRVMCMLLRKRRENKFLSLQRASKTMVHLDGRERISS